MGKKVRDLTLAELERICKGNSTCLNCLVHKISLDEILCSEGLCKEIGEMIRCDDIPSHLELDKEIAVDLEV